MIESLIYTVRQSQILFDHFDCCRFLFMSTNTAISLTLFPLFFSFFRLSFAVDAIIISFIIFFSPKNDTNRKRIHSPTRKTSLFFHLKKELIHLIHAEYVWLNFRFFLSTCSFLDFE